MKNLIMSLIAILAIALFSGQSLADQTLTKSNAYTADQLIGRNVDNLNGEHIGKIRDINFNVDTGEINYIILGKSMLGIGEDTTSAVPLEALKIQNYEGSVTVTLIVSEFRLLGAPGMTTYESAEDFRNRLQEYYCDGPDFEKNIDGPKRC